MGSYFQFLREIDYFGDLSDSDIDAIQAVCHEEAYEAGEIIFFEGTQRDKFYIVLEGSVEIWKEYTEPDKTLLAVYGKGKMFGEIALIDDLPRTATVITKEPTRLLAIYQEDFYKIMIENSSIAFSIMKSISAMIRKTNEKYIEDLTMKNRRLEKAYRRMKQEIEDRQRAEEELKRYRDHLADLVKEQSGELTETNKKLKQEIEDRIQAQEEKDELIQKLQNALLKVDTLSGLFPICAKCRKIRDDKGYWKQIEAFIQEHSEAEVRYSICAECSTKRYPKFYKEE